MDEVLSRGMVVGHHGGRRPCVAGPSAPPDRYNGVYLALVLAGAGFLLPYNSFIVAADYFQAEYPGSTIVFDLSLVYIIVAFCSVLMNNALVEAVNMHTRITFGYILSFSTLLFVALFEVWWQVFSHSTSYAVNLMAVSVVAVGCSVQQSSFYGYAGMLPSRYTQAVMAGESAAGVLVSGSRIATRLLLDDVRLNTLVFFGASLVLVLVCGILHQLVSRSEFVRHHVTACSDAAPGVGAPGDQVTLVDILEEADEKDYGLLTLNSNSSDSAFQSTETLPAGYDTFAESPRGSSTSAGVGGSTKYRVSELLVRVKRSGRSRPFALDCCSALRRGALARSATVRRVWPYMLSIGLAYLVTLSLFPGIESEVPSCRLKSWMPVILMAIFNGADFIGKILASLPYEWTRRQLVMFSVARFLLIPPMVMCATPRASPLISAILFQQFMPYNLQDDEGSKDRKLNNPHDNRRRIGEMWPMALSLLLGLSNGVVGSLPMILAPDKVPEQNRELCGNVMTISYSMGLTAGSFLAYGLHALLGPPLSSTCGVLNITGLCLAGCPQHGGVEITTLPMVGL